MTYTASSHLGAIETLWFHFPGLVWHAWVSQHTISNLNVRKQDILNQEMYRSTYSGTHSGVSVF